jgi:PAS domain-containing protein
MARNSLLVAGHVLLLRGMLVFRGHRVGGALELVLAALFLLPFGYLSLDAAQLPARIAYYGLFSGSLSLATVAVALRRRPPHFGSNDVLLALWLALFAAISYLRAAQELGNVSTAFEAIGSVGGIYALAQILSVQLVTLTLISMNSQRIEWDHGAAALQLQASESQLRIVGDNLPDGFVYRYELVDGEPRFSYISGGVEDTLGVTPAQAMADARSVFAHMAEESRARYEADEAHSAQALSVFASTLRFDRPDGRPLWLHVRSRPQRRPDGGTFWDGVALNARQTYRINSDGALGTGSAEQDKYLKDMMPRLIAARKTPVLEPAGVEDPADLSGAGAKSDDSVEFAEIEAPEVEVEADCVEICTD